MGVTNSYNLSPLQKGMLFHYLTDRTAGIDIDQMFCHLKESIDKDKLQKAWDEVITNHEVCRTNFLWEEVDQPIQTINDDIRAQISCYDWQDLPNRARDSKLKLFLEEDRAKGFDLNRAPLIRLTLIKINEEEYYFIWTFHHIIMDGRSHAI
ncbi:MAG TPA: condensation domain-containing protein, partial [Ignavibacteriaceae bacterium]